MKETFQNLFWVLLTDNEGNDNKEEFEVHYYNNTEVYIYLPQCFSISSITYIHFERYHSSCSYTLNKI